MKRITVGNYTRDRFYPKIVRAVQEILRECECEGQDLCWSGIQPLS